ncbi:zinc-binding metallopeptidase family protein [Donghicola mangrovi]|uniref:Zinc-ribbon domain-containing protein n=1 Tax=Donghicola mangrovi TaxID=2729614 RepID=A0A850QAW5_9RHOB|nr:putative zinc-binding metallopeptidase [Donghicola mangrovi]NVO23960.1 hypothetical protein [Donghicola mangrovi]
MQVFHCPACAARVYFDNLACTCGQALVFAPDTQAITALQTGCANRDRIGCNWTPMDGGLCRSCAMTETVPDTDRPANIDLWSRTEEAKRWMLANLSRWGWFGPQDTGALPVFQLLSEKTSDGKTRVVMGHADGEITINVSEASPVTLAARQTALGELYRTMVGHMRHEMAHFLFLRLSEDPAFLSEFRATFGDERADYGAALEQHYADPAPMDGTYITSYASAHPHEDWAETTAHLLHLVDLLDSVQAVGIGFQGGPQGGYDPYQDSDTENMIRMAIDATLAINHVNRALDLPDLYPFVLTPAVKAKLALAHRYLRRTVNNTAPQPELVA